MGKVGQRNTNPELALRRILHIRGIRYRLNDRKLPGSPDIKLTGYRAVIFVNGCFWHAHEGCKFATVPTTRNEFWVNKFKENRERDREVISRLLKMDWRVLIVWECAIKTDLSRTADFVLEWLTSESTESEIGVVGKQILICRQGMEGLVHERIQT